MTPKEQYEARKAERDKLRALVKCHGLPYTATIGRLRNGCLTEIFLTNHKNASYADACARDSAIICWLALQHGVPLPVIALLRDGIGRPSTPLGAALDALKGEVAR
jgi:hypothetical protein